MKPGIVFRLLLAASLGLPAALSAQTLTLTNGIQTFSSLLNTTVTLSNRCELRLTAASNAIPGCTVNLDSSDAWLLFTAIKPSVVASNHLGQIRVNGAAAVADANVRVVQYGPGTVVIPHAPSYQPLQVFNGPYLTGASASFGQYVYHTGAGLGAMDLNIRSFRLKRGYMAVLAQNTTGGGFSQCYVAQDGDLEVSVLPAPLDQRIRFIYVTPWRWTSKKGIAGDIQNGLNVQWKYNWNLNQNSTPDLEYVAIRQNRWWPSLAQDWQTRGVNTVLGYNEPDQAAQSDLTVGEAIASWPDLLAPGLRVGSPAVSDGGRSSWLYPFLQQADAAGLRVDFVAIHYYQCRNPADLAGAATQMYNFLKATYDQVRRPLWITEWNNGANWTSCADPTYAQQQAAISAMVDMLESTPFVERYAAYNWVEDVRRLSWDDGSLTDAGVTYRDKVSTLSHRQALPDNGARGLAQFLFETNVLDGSGCGNNGLAAGIPGYSSGHTGQALVLDGTNSYVQLPPNVGGGSNFTFAAWVKWAGGASWQRIFDFGADTTQYFYLTPGTSAGLTRLILKNGTTEQILEAPGLPVGQWRHVAVTISGTTARLYTNGVLAATAAAITVTPDDFAHPWQYLGRSQYATTPLFRGSLDEVIIADYAFTAAQIAALQTNQPPQFTTRNLARAAGIQGQAYSDSISGTATDPNPGDTLTYSKILGPDWLSVSANGTLGGTPDFNESGTNTFTVRVTDAAGAADFALLTIVLPDIFTNGVWSADASGNWSETNKWSGNRPANGAGFTADFSTLNITASRTVTLNHPRRIGALKFGDTSGAQAWFLAATNGSVLTLDAGAGVSPGITVSQNTATLGVPLAGVGGFTKRGAGTLVLATNNSFSGELNVDTAQASSGNDGVVRIAAPGALGAVSAISILNQNSATSALQLDGSAGGISSSAAITLSGRNNSVAPIQNLAGTNTLDGGLTIRLGGGNHWIQSDAGLLTLGGTLSSSSTGPRTFTFQGGGDIVVSGVLADGSASAVNVTKAGAGRLTLLGANTYSGVTTLGGGALQVGNGGSAGTLGTNSMVNNAALIFNLSGPVDAPATISGSGSVTKLGGGTLVLTNANSFAGGTTLAQGILQAGTDSAFGTGPITCDSGTNTARIILGDGVTVTNPLTALSVNPVAGNNGLIMVGDNTSATFAGPVSIQANAASGGHFCGPLTSGLLHFTGPVTAPNPAHFLVVRAGQVRFSGGGSYSEIQSRLHTTSLGANNGIATNAVMDLGGNGSTNAATLFDLNGFSQTLAGLRNAVAANNAARVTNSSGIPGVLTLALGTNACTFGGGILGNLGLVLNSGTQTLTRSGTTALNGIYSYTGSTVLNGGRLVLGAGMSLPNTPVIRLGTGAVLDAAASGLTLGPGQMLSGNGAVAGNTTVNGALMPGLAGIGSLTFSNSLTLGAASLTAVELDAGAGTNDVIRCLGTLAYNGTLAITNLGGTLAPGTSFKLFDAPGRTGTFSAIAGNPGPQLAWSFNPTNGVLGVTSTVATNPAPIAARFSGGVLQLSWPEGHTGWKLLAQTNPLGIGLDTNWFVVPGSSATNQMFIPVDAANPSVYFRLRYP